jgi:predicted permease
MTNLILILICLLIGFCLQRAKSLPKDAHQTLNSIILYVPLPATALLTIPQMEWDFRLVSLCLAPWILFGFSCAFFYFLGHYLGWSKSVIGCLTITAGLGNTAFVGFPIIEAMYGREVVKLAVLLDQTGSFIIVSSLGLWIASIYSSAKLKTKELVQKIIVFPPFVGFVLAMSLASLGWQADGEVKSILEKLSALLTPMALISVGLQLKLSELKLDLNYLMIGLSFKLILSPLLIFFIYRFLNLPLDVYRVAVIESAMAPMITGSIVAASHGLHPRLAGSLLGLGVPISFITLAFWYSIV